MKESKSCCKIFNLNIEKYIAVNLDIPNEDTDVSDIIKYYESYDKQMFTEPIGLANNYPGDYDICNIKTINNKKCYDKFNKPLPEPLLDPILLQGSVSDEEIRRLLEAKLNELNE